MTEESVFAEALGKQDHQERAAFLDRACAGDLRLRQNVESLLSAYDAGQFLESPAPAMATDDEPPIAERPGTLIGPYKLLEQIGEGGMGLVFVAEQQHPVRRKVALKVIKPGMDTRQVVARFEAERQALALMDHPSIAKVHDGGETASGRPYFVMELVKGVSITEYCDRQRLTTRQRLELFVPVCQAVQHAHQKGVIHRDLKPSNVLVTVIDGAAVPKVIDFGIAKATGQQLTDKTLYTAFAQLVGTPLYMSPEQAVLSGADVDTRSDIYSLGVLLYELLTGTTPFESETLRQAGYDEMRRIIREEEPPRPSTRLSTLGQGDLATVCERRGVDPAKLSRDVRGELDWIVMKALEKDRNRRYESASAFAADVRRYLNDEPVEASPPSTALRLRKWARRHQTLMWSSVVALVLIAVGSVLAAVFFQQQETEQRRLANDADTQRKLAVQNAEEAQRQTREALRATEEVNRQRKEVYQNLYHADMRLGLVDWNAGNVARLSHKLRSHLPQPGREDIRGWEWYYLLSLCHQDERTLLDRCNMVLSVAWSPDGRYLASASWDPGTVLVRDATSWRLLRTEVGQFGLSWSPDSRQLAWGTLSDSRAGASGVFVWHAATNEIKALRGHTTSVWTVAWSPDGKQLASSGMDDSIRIWDPATGSCLRVLPQPPGHIHSVAWSPDGKRLASASRGVGLHMGLHIWDAVSGKVLQGNLYAGDAQSVAWSPDGSRLALGGNEKCVVFRTADWSQAAQLVGHNGSVSCVAWSPDGDQLATAGSDHLIKLWDPASGACTGTLRGHLNQVLSVAWEPNGRRLASSGMDGNVKIWPIPPAPQPRRLDGNPGSVQAIAWGEEPNTLRSLDAAKGSLTLWNVATGEQLSQTPVAHAGDVGHLGSRGRLLTLSITEKGSPRLLVCDARSGNTIQLVRSGVQTEGVFSFSPDESQLAARVAYDTVEIVDLRRGAVRFRQEVIAARAISWSPDGRLLAVAGGGNRSDGGDKSRAGWVHVFDTETGQRSLKLQHGTHRVGATAVAWSPNGQRLVSGDVNGLAEVWEVPSGRKVASIQLHTSTLHALAWSPDCRRVASGAADRTVRVWDPTDGEELLKFETPNGAVTQLLWSRDGRRLVAACAEGIIYIWDASRGYDFINTEADYTEQVRGRLKQATELQAAGRGEEALALYEQTVQTSKARLGPDHPETFASMIELADALGRAGRSQEALALWRQTLEKQTAKVGRHNPNTLRTVRRLLRAYRAAGRREERRAVYQEIIRLKIDDAEAYNNLAWDLATCPDPKSRDSTQAVALAQQAVKHAPKMPTCWNTLGAAHYRAGDWKAAVTALEKSMELGKGGDAGDWFFLAMAHWRLGDKEQARQWYDKAVPWMEKNKPQDDELRRFRAEAEALLGIKDFLPRDGKEVSPR
jgi:WD40 repeat protein/serine/threonine protein kinase/Flp pilus assembly protein TadD